jgi:hypothetical protein
MRVEQEQKVTEDARIFAEQDAAAQKFASHVLQVSSVCISPKLQPNERLAADSSN